MNIGRILMAIEMTIWALLTALIYLKEWILIYDYFKMFQRIYLGLICLGWIEGILMARQLGQSKGFSINNCPHAYAATTTLALFIAPIFGQY